jgi:hypothetical protein
LGPLIRVVLVALSVSPIPPIFPKKAFRSGGEARSLSACSPRLRFFQ